MFTHMFLMVNAWTGTRREIGQLTVCKKLAAIPVEHDAPSLLWSCSIINHPLIKNKLR